MLFCPIRPYFMLQVISFCRWATTWQTWGGRSTWRFCTVSCTSAWTFPACTSTSLCVRLTLRSPSQVDTVRFSYVTLCSGFIYEWTNLKGGATVLGPDLGWLFTVLLSAWSCLGWWEVGSMGRASGQDEWNIEVKVNPTQVRDLLNHPVIGFLVCNEKSKLSMYPSSR